MCGKFPLELSYFSASLWLPGRKAAAKSFANEIEKAHFHKVYVFDFLDFAGARSEKGCFFSSNFSTNLSKDAHNFAVVNRIEAQKQLNELHVSARDFQQPETLSKVATALGADAILVGTADISSTDAKLSLSLREAASGKEIHAMDYHEPLEAAFLGLFPAFEDVEAHTYFFPGMDGVSLPRCVHCPEPSYTDEARRNKFQGKVVLSVIVDEKGSIRDVRVVEDPRNGLAQRSIDVLKKWRMQPSRDPQGKPVTVRVQIETLFKLL
ncbi:MAG TPA: energy transducer TonB [Terriglobales bacterium]|nr:energy transducer TonB [Terriglobales bacterium]